MTKATTIAWLLRIGFEASAILLLANLFTGSFTPSFWHTFFGIYVGWYAFCVLFWVYRTVVDTLVFRIIKTMIVNEQVQMMIEMKMPADEFPYEEFGTYLDRVVADASAPGIAKFQAGVMAGILQCHTALFPRLRLQKVYNEARLLHRRKLQAT
ncbi:hypothetical protein NKH19_00685 [Mesorhizobium sp. M1338]|uniref:hypothetical protein n=1 Tax=unclassified Mesorhizobium TaxID=325217 RepID=UPI00333D79A4